MIEKLAVALADLDRVDPELRGPLLAGRLDLTTAIRVGADRAIEDTPVVMFTCDLLTAATVCDILRSNDRKLGDQPTRLYIHRGQSWSRVNFNEILTVLVAGKVKLNPLVFPSVQLEANTPPPKVKVLGKKG